jgi:hypothetical protein
VRKRRVDFAALDRVGGALLWKVELASRHQACVPRVIGVRLRGETAANGRFSRAAPVVQANVLYAGNYETPAVTWAEPTCRGRVSASRLYDPNEPSRTLAGERILWEAGEVLRVVGPDRRRILFPDMTVHPVAGEHLADEDGRLLHGDGQRTFFTGLLAHRPVQATSVRLYDPRPEVFSDRLSHRLSGSLGGQGTIDRFRGRWSVTFRSPPAEGAPIRADYAWYEAGPALKTFEPGMVTNDELALSDAFVWPDGYRHDFDGDGRFDQGPGQADAAWLVQWVRGYRNPGSGQKKQWLLGAVDHSVPALLVPPGYPRWLFGTDVGEEERQGYERFRERHQQRRAVLFVGARDGMLHAFDAGQFCHGDDPDTPGVREQRGYFRWQEKTPDSPAYCADFAGARCPDYGSGWELWAFVPANLLPRLKNNLLSGDGRAFVDASPAIADVFIDTDGDRQADAWRTVLVSAEGNGGDTVFCLDVTDPVNPHFLWEFASPELFRSRSAPAVGRIGRIRDPLTGGAKWAAFFVTGRLACSDRFPAIYVIDMADGSLLQRIELDAAADLDGDGRLSAGEMDHGRGGVLSGRPAVVDSDDNGFVDRLYVGSDRGLLYKVLLPDDPSRAQGQIAHCVLNEDFTDAAGYRVPDDRRFQPIYASPLAVADNTVSAAGELRYRIRVFFGTGDSPFFDENINAAATRYYFFGYVDAAEKGQCAPDRHYLERAIELATGHRVYASAFAAAGQIYFGTAAAETEDPCEGHLYSEGNQGMLYALDLEAVTLFSRTVGNLAIPPLVEDEHLYLRLPAGLQSFGSGRYNNEVRALEVPVLRVRAWEEVE